MYHLVSFLVRLLSYIPFRVMYVLSDLLFYPVYYVVRYRRRIVRKNLTESFPDKSLEEVKSIEKKFYHFLIDLILESSKLATLSPEKFKKRVKFVNIELMNGMLSQGKTVAAYIGHYGNWEWMSTVGLWIYEGATCAQIYHKLNNPSMDRLMTHLRERAGGICVEMHKTARFAANIQESGKPYTVAFIADQGPRAREIRHYVPFLNHDVPVLVGSERITKHYNYGAIFVGMRRIKRGYYECEFSLLHDNPSSLPDYALTDLYFQRLEQQILERPELYLWSHNRFRLARKKA